MKKLIAAGLLSAGVLGTMSLSGCATDNPIITEQDLTVKTHFYPIVNGSKYTYIRSSNNIDDTVTYQVRVGQTRADMNYLDRVDSSTRSPQVLYYFSLAQDQFGNPAAVLKDTKDTAQFYALAGNLEIGSNPWIAQESPRLYGQVVKAYDEFIDDDMQFHDVILVKYWSDESKPYTLRFYAKNFGLIKEKHMTATDVELSSMQLVARSDTYGNWIRPEGLPPVEHRFGKAWKLDMLQEQMDIR